ncbi:hypothetical protein EU508_19850 [Pseudoalteromonas fuliginea]|uniref:Uncharacterized protein n=1 Tax=Pseudoalteromonas fuliginea TaxID=1872678 RepID=A0AB73BAZ4_9GAMM|nr:hypothetical protein [Pseudoalteromonas fuliginea]KAA1156342.1 hypothetical protein EU508_19850 [Pseudoalteromonas fuliginea]
MKIRFNFEGHKHIVLWLCLLFTSNRFALEQKYHEFVLPVITAFKAQDKTAIAAHIRYPLKRRYPIPDIKNEAEFINRFDEIFNDELVAAIAASNINIDWDSVGWRGIMLNNGLMWVDTDGKIIGINYHTAKEQAFAERLIEQDKQSLHSSVNNFEKPVLDWKTANYHIRVDDLGDHNYRYAVWGINKKLSDKPSMALLNGDITFEGSGGNYHYTFKNCRCSYVPQVAIIGCYYLTAGCL